MPAVMFYGKIADGNGASFTNNGKPPHITVAFFDRNRGRANPTATSTTSKATVVPTTGFSRNRNRGCNTTATPSNGSSSSSAKDGSSCATTNTTTTTTTATTTTAGGDVSAHTAWDSASAADCCKRVCDGLKAEIAERKVTAVEFTLGPKKKPTDRSYPLIVTPENSWLYAYNAHSNKPRQPHVEMIGVKTDLHGKTLVVDLSSLHHQ